MHIAAKTQRKQESLISYTVLSIYPRQVACVTTCPKAHHLLSSAVRDFNMIPLECQIVFQGISNTSTPAL